MSFIGDAGFDYIELWGEVPHAYPGWIDKKRLLDILSNYNMVVTTHAPFTDLNPASPFQPVKGAVEETLEGFVEFSSDLGAAMVTMHPGSVHNAALVPRSEGTSVEVLRKMIKVAGGRLSINVENVMRNTSKYHYPLASTIESLESILADVGGSKCTLDTGHAYASGLDLVAMADRLGDKIAEIHLHDNPGSTDDHLIPGSGNAHLRGLMDKMSGKEVLVCLELNPYKYSQGEVLEYAKRAKSQSVL